MLHGGMKSAVLIKQGKRERDAGSIRKTSIKTMFLCVSTFNPISKKFHHNDEIELGHGAKDCNEKQRS
jgi:hypothetical protein